ncbi:TetR/AcrR family transcriptional regulator [Isoptericola cucumis]|uniref:TetR/AcrR family transcriptional regulator n=1 Tax=Isoptericola cucumis TaxID=1776856 RepID=UPI00166D0D44|nr:TetR/AcrR family transcriptional regulator C-terminal domain-containing protein [Isoptericola cucumis]
MRSQATPRRPQGRHAGVTRAALLDAATELVDRDGLAALSMRRLGAAVGVEAMTVQHHVGTKDQLLDGLVERLLDGVLPDLPDAGDWQGTLRAVAHGFRAQLLAHPRLVPVVATRPGITPATLRGMERALEAMQPSELGPARALEMVYAVIGLVLGQVGMEVAAGDDTTADRVGRLDAADLDGLPLLQQAVGEAPGRERRSVFEVSLEALIRGLATGSSPAAEPQPAGRSTGR